MSEENTLKETKFDQTCRQILENTGKVPYFMYLRKKQEEEANKGETTEKTEDNKDTIVDFETTASEKEDTKQDETPEEELQDTPDKMDVDDREEMLIRLRKNLTPEERRKRNRENVLKALQRKE